MGEINRRQFIIAKTEYYGDDFVQERLNDNYYLSYQRELDIRRVGDTVLIGKAFSCAQRGNVDLSNALTHMYEWAGRWVLITNNMLFLDACGTLGVFYLKDNEENIICSSSLKLIEEMFPEVEFKTNHRIRRHDFGFFDFYPGPYTPVEGVMSLLPSQFIDFKKNKIDVRNDINFQRYEKQNKNELLIKIVDAEATILKNISEEYADEIWLPLTGGEIAEQFLLLLIMQILSLIHILYPDRTQTHGILLFHKNYLINVILCIIYIKIGIREKRLKMNN